MRTPNWRPPPTDATAMSPRGRILVGTCSWADKTLIDSGRFYPRKSMASKDRLAFYATRYPFVEVDTSFYAIPAPATTQTWVDATPPGFLFDVKAYGLLTQHPVQPQTLPPSVRPAFSPDLLASRRLSFGSISAEQRALVWDAFKESLAPIAAAGKLGALVFQFPPWFEDDEGRQRYLTHLAENAAPYRVAVEFRNHTWLADATAQRETLALLRDNGLCYVAVDEPQGFESSVPPVMAATGPVAIVRLHGRNRGTWEHGGASASDRFDYYYRREELAEWVPQAVDLADTGIEVHMSLNTNKGDQGPVNADLLLELLDERGAAHPMPRPTAPNEAPPGPNDEPPPPGQLTLF